MRRYGNSGPGAGSPVARPWSIARKRLGQMLFGGRNAAKADHEDISEQVGVNVLGAPAHVVLLEAPNPSCGWRLQSLSWFSWGFSPALSVLDQNPQRVFASRGRCILHSVPYNKASSDD